jgi:surface antigen
MDDGTPFVWRRNNGRLSGIVRPTASFRSPKGDLCRHVVVLLTTGFKTRTAEGVACRLANGRWQLEG